jgi:hypothetical protein
MGCSPSLPIFEERSDTQPQKAVVTIKKSVSGCGDEFNLYFKGLYPKEDRICSYLGYMKRMDTNNALYNDSISLLSGFYRHATWDIYIHFGRWPQKVTKSFVQNLLTEFRASKTEWLSKLKGYEGFPLRKVEVRLFGIVLEEGVETDSSFDSFFSKYPVVRNWKKDGGEASPWKVSSTSMRDLPQNFMYLKKLDLHSLRVTGNKGGARYSPNDWSSYTHPEGCKGFQTKLWIESGEWNATAQRHYLRLKGVISEASNGKLKNVERTVLKHEMGHNFFLDDMYDTKKYPRMLPSCNCPPSCPSSCSGIEKNDTIMFGSPTITPMDHAMIRKVWTRQKPLIPPLPPHEEL